jgi:hypothetical protein
MATVEAALLLVGTMLVDHEGRSDFFLCSPFCLFSAPRSRRWTMMTKELAEQMRAEVKQFVEVQGKFLQTYKQLCLQYGGAEWKKKHIDKVFHQVRDEVIPIMEQLGMDPNAVQALCSWAEKLVMTQ